MTLRIEQRSQQGKTVLKLIGQIHSEDLEHFKAQTLEAGPGMVFDETSSSGQYAVAFITMNRNGALMQPSVTAD